MCPASLSVAWREKLDQALAHNKQESAKYYQVATVRPDGRPANRTVAHRDFYGHTALEWVTDSRTSKVEEVKRNPHCEAAWYFEASREQFRFTGELSVISKDHSDCSLLEERQRMWSSMPPEGRGHFTVPQPGLPRQPGDEHLFQQEPPPAESKAFDVFCLVILDVDMVDHLNLVDMRRVQYRSLKGPDGKRVWQAEDVNL